MRNILPVGTRQPALLYEDKVGGFIVKKAEVKNKIASKKKLMKEDGA